MYTDERKLLQDMNLIGMKDARDILGWSRAKLSVYHSRGSLPLPIGYISGKPIWKREQIEAYKEEKETHKTKGD